MILNALLKKRVDAIAQMGMLECESFRNEVINSLLDNPTKNYIYDHIDKRVSNLNRDSAIINNEDPFISGFEVEA